jgi:hypothetical protein
MPYIEQFRRNELNRQGAARIGEFCASVGELNYVLTRICLSYLSHHHKCYATMNEILGVLAAIGFEFYRRVAADYENEKIAANGDVYPARGFE